MQKTDQTRTGLRLASQLDHTDGWHSTSDTPPAWWLLLHNEGVPEGEAGRYFVGRYTTEGYRDLRNRPCEPTHWHQMPDPIKLGQ